MSELPKTGLYVATQKDLDLRLVVENAYGEDPADFFLVEVIQESAKGDPMAMGDELDNAQWNELVQDYGLEYRG